MKAVLIQHYGGNEVIEIKEVPRPLPGPDDVLIKVRAASINPLDWKIRCGMAKLLTGYKFPKILGSECAGEVSATGSHVRRFKPGDRVIGFPGIRRLSAFAEYACADEKKCFHMPANIGYGEASALPIAGCTALQSLRDLGGIKPGSRVLINGASGGVGTFAVQIGKIYNAQITAICSGPNLDLVRGLGADRAIDYTKENFLDSDERYDLIFDAVSKLSFGRCKGLMSTTGLYVNTLPFPAVLIRQYITGFLDTRKAKSVMVKPNIADMDWIRARIETGGVRVVLDRTYPVERIAEALAYSETGKAKGKIIVSFDDPVLR